MGLFDKLKGKESQAPAQAEQAKEDSGAEPKGKYIVTYNRNGCIGVAMCAFIDSRFVMNQDNKADMTGSMQRGDGKFILYTDEPVEDMGNDLRRAADSCPAGVIRIDRTSDGKKIAGR